MKIYDEIKKEIKYLFWLFIILVYGLIVCDIANRRAIWDYEFQNWEYNINCQVPDGWSRAIMDPDEK